MNVEELIPLVKRAGEEIKKIYYSQEFDTSIKEDKTPLTTADTLSNDIICSFLEKYNLPILSEENKEIPYSIRKEWKYYWCVDPLDGTKEFLKRNGEFTINIALIHKDKPIMGIVYAPVLETLYFAQEGKGAYKDGKPLPKDRSIHFPLKVVASKSHLNLETQKFIENLGEVELISKGSSLKFCLVAEGKADIYPRIAPTMEWDTAAADIIVRESGRGVYIYDEKFYLDPKTLKAKGNRLKYNKENLVNPSFVVV